MQEANMLQIIIFAIFLGVALLALGQKAEEREALDEAMAWMDQQTKGGVQP